MNTLKSIPDNSKIPKTESLQDKIGPNSKIGQNSNIVKAERLVYRPMLEPAQPGIARVYACSGLDKAWLGTIDTRKEGEILFSAPYSLNVKIIHLDGSESLLLAGFNLRREEKAPSEKLQNGDRIIFSLRYDEDFDDYAHGYGLEYKRGNLEIFDSQQGKCVLSYDERKKIMDKFKKYATEDFPEYAELIEAFHKTKQWVAEGAPMDKLPFDRERLRSIIGIVGEKTKRLCETMSQDDVWLLRTFEMNLRSLTSHISNTPSYAKEFGPQNVLNDNERSVGFPKTYSDIMNGNLLQMYNDEYGFVGPPNIVGIY